jgi:pyruvate formate lyase activating enzyme
VEVLPFHQMAQHKWQALGRTYALADTPTPTHEQVREARALFAARALDVT